jgi:acetyltransferase-like isoleucine patch superfamily enzyme
MCQLIPNRADLLSYLLKDLPGDVGARLRAEWYPSLFGGWGEGIEMRPGVTFIHPERIALGSRVRIEERVHLDATRGGGMVFADGVRLCFGSYLITHTDVGYIRIGEGSYIGAYSQVWGHAGVEIGSHVLAAPGLLIVPYQHTFTDVNTPIYLQGGSQQRVVIEDDVYLGMGMRVLSGVTIGRGSVVGAGAVVTRDVPPLSIAVGVPARVIRTRSYPLGLRGYQKC